LLRRNTTIYDLAGRALATTDGLGNRTTTVFDVAGRTVFASLDRSRNVPPASRNRTCGTNHRNERLGCQLRQPREARCCIRRCILLASDIPGGRRSTLLIYETTSVSGCAAGI
jgi:hypothetical protein